MGEFRGSEKNVGDLGETITKDIVFDNDCIAFG